MRNSRHASADCDGRLARYSSIVKLERQLNVPWRLRAGNLAHGRSKAHIRSVVLNMIEEVDEVTPELQSDPFRDWKVLMQAHIHVGITRRPEATKLRSAISERAGGGLNEVVIVGEPLATYIFAINDGVCVLDRRQ